MTTLLIYSPSKAESLMDNDSFKVAFNTQNRKEILNHIKECVAKEKYANMIDVEMAGKQLVVVISKLATSKLFIEETKINGDMVYTLKDEDIAYIHESFKDDVFKKLSNIITKAGGKVI
jgi:hypothetical protein